MLELKLNHVSKRSPWAPLNAAELAAVGARSKYIWSTCSPSLVKCGKAIHQQPNMINITMTSQWVGWRLKSPASRLFTQPFIRAQIKENIKAPRHWPLCGEFTGDRWIPRTNGQLRGKCFHLMTSSWSTWLLWNVWHQFVTRVQQTGWYQHNVPASQIK